MIYAGLFCSFGGIGVFGGLSGSGRHSSGGVQDGLGFLGVDCVGGGHPLVDGGVVSCILGALQQVSLAVTSPMLSTVKA